MLDLSESKDHLQWSLAEEGTLMEIKQSIYTLRNSTPENARRLLDFLHGNEDEKIEVFEVISACLHENQHTEDYEIRDILVAGLTLEEAAMVQQFLIDQTLEEDNSYQREGFFKLFLENTTPSDLGKQRAQKELALFGKLLAIHNPYYQRSREME
jgi:hypothetical protein